MTEAMNEENVWYLARDGRQHGPLSHLEMTKLVELGHLRATDLVWRPGFADWRPAPSVFDLTPAPPKPSVPPPAPEARQEMAKAEPQRAEAAAATQNAPAARPQPSFANMSNPVSPTAQTVPAAAPASFEFPAADAGPAVSAPSRSNDQPQFDAGGFGGDSGSRFGTPSSSETEFGMAPASEQFRMEPFHVDDALPRRKSGVAIALGLLTVIGGLSAAGYVYRDTIKATLESTSADLPVVEAPATPAGNADTAGVAAPSPAAPPEATADVAAAQPDPAAAPAAAAPVTETPDPIDTALQASPFWSFAKAEFPEWYADRVREVSEMKAANQPDTAIDTKLVEQIVVLRRQNASKALAASPARLKEIAEAFVTNLNDMQSQSVDVCYEFIEKGELTPAAAALVQKPAEGAALHAQLRAVLAAVVEGQQNPVTRTQPQPADYNLLAAELGTIGWSQADIQLFADPKALAAAPREQVCKMVKDWFTAHLSVKDDPARERLLYETLRLVIAG